MVTPRTVANRTVATETLFHVEHCKPPSAAERRRRGGVVKRRGLVQRVAKLRAPRRGALTPDARRGWTSLDEQWGERRESLCEVRARPPPQPPMLIRTPAAAERRRTGGLG